MRQDQLASELGSLLGQLTRFARWLSGSPLEADDIVQETLIRALAARSEVREPRAIRAWVFRIARNVHVDLRRGQASRERYVVLEGGLDDLSKVETHGTAPIASFDALDLERALLKLPEAARTALLLTDLWELDHEEVAAVLEVPVGTVKSRVARARARVASWLTEDATNRRERRGA